MSQRFILKATGKSFNVVGTHLKAKPKFVDIRSKQCQHLIETFGSSTDTLIFGDFNDTPESEPLKMMASTFASLSSEFAGQEPEFTTMKFREYEGMQKRTIDYIFAAKNFAKVVGSLELPLDADIDQHMANPCKDHPSDHYSLCFDLQI